MILKSKDERICASRRHISALETALSTARERDTAIAVEGHAQNAKALASTALNIARQENSNALLGSLHLQQAL